jgi:NAD(P)-dependent dehydrogenase (short-subunit alcohol dehydrogenase family)
MELGLSGKAALVTGGSRGIGAAIATELAREGVHVCLVARDRTKLHQVAASLTTNTVHTAVHVADLRDPHAAAQAVATTIAAFGRLDILVNNAAATKRDDFFTLTDEDFLDGFALKFHGAVRMTRAAWPHLQETKGCIVNIAGVGAHQGSADFTIGGSVNAALLNFTKAMSDIGIQQGVRVNAINPGLIETERYTRNVERIMREQSLTRSQAIAARLATHRTTRVGRPEEVGTLVAYLASDKADFIQGALIDIDGGSTRAL